MIPTIPDLNEIVLTAQVLLHPAVNPPILHAWLQLKLLAGDAGALADAALEPQENSGHPGDICPRRAGGAPLLPEG
jgi:hypothetical protein